MEEAISQRDRDLFNLIASLENQVEDLALIAPEPYEDKTVDEAIHDKNKMFERSLTAIQENSSFVPLLNEQLTFDVMKETVSSENKELDLVLSTAPVMPPNFRQEELDLNSYNDEEEEDKENEDDEIAEMRITMRDCKRDLDYVLETWYPDYYEDIKYILSVCEKESRRTEADKECLITFNELQGAENIKALEILIKSNILQKLDDDTYKFVIYDSI